MTTIMANQSIDDLERQLEKYPVKDRERMRRRIMRTVYPIENIEWYGRETKFCCNAGIRVTLKDKFICLGCGKHHERKENQDG